MVKVMPLDEKTWLQKRSDVARVVKGLHSFNCNPHVYLRMEWTAYLPKLVLTDPGVGLGTTTVNKQSAHDPLRNGNHSC